MVFFQKQIEKLWYQPKASICLWLLWPLSKLYIGLIWIRKFLYQHRVFPSYRLNVPVIVVGNITVGGTGKTPVVIYIAELLKKQGLNPGIISRGYKGQSKQVTAVTINSDPVYIGDEPVLIAMRTGCPVVVGKDRVAAGKYLLQHYAVDIVIADDGLQHYSLARDIEIIMIDGTRRFGNGCCLPMGPLREKTVRLKQADLLVVNGGEALSGEFIMQLSSGYAYNLMQIKAGCRLEKLSGTKVHAIAGIGSPNKFFNYLKTKGLDIIPHVFPDHHAFKAQDLDFTDDYPIIMTEKDAVKFQYLIDNTTARKYVENKNNAWYLPISVILSANFDESFLKLINKFKNVR